MFKKTLPFVLAALFAASGLGLAQDQAVLEAGGETVTQSEFDRRFDLAVRNLAAQQGLPYNEQTQALFDQLQPQYLEQLASEEALLQEAGTRGLSLSDEEINAQLEQIRSGFESEDAYNQFLAEAGFEDEEALRTFVSEQGLIQRTVEALRGELSVSDEEVQTYYEENQERFGASFEEAAPAVRQELENVRLGEEITGLRETYGVQTFPENLSASIAPGGVVVEPATGGAATGGAATGGAMQEQMNMTPEAALQNLQGLLGQGVDTVATPELADAFGALRESVAADPNLQALATPIQGVESALTADPFDQAALVEALQALALEMRTVASENTSDASTLIVELASLVDQTADFIQNEGYTPRMDVETP